MGSKYGPIAEHLSRQRASPCRLTFAQVEELLRQPLPRSARNPRTYRAWWGNDVDGSSRHVQAMDGWAAADWRVADVDLTREEVTFARAGAAPRRSGSAAMH